MNFAFSADHGVKWKKSEMIDKYLHLPSDLGKLWNMRVTVIQMITGAHGTVPKTKKEQWESFRSECCTVAEMVNYFMNQIILPPAMGK